MTKKKEPEISFEEALDELEKITRDLESGKLTLDASIEAYERGMNLKKICQDMLARAEKKLESLEKNEKGQIEKKTIQNGKSQAPEEEPDELF